MKERHWRDLSIRDKPLIPAYTPFRIVCPVCGVRVEKVPWAPRWSRVTTDLARSTALLARKMSWKETAEFFGLDWKVVASIVRRAVAEGLQKRKWKPLHVIGVDEVSRKKGHEYLTLVYDLERKRLIWVGKDRKEETLNKFAKMIRRHLDGILAWTKLRVSNGALEGMNNKVKLVSHRAFGFRNADNYIVNIFHCCADLPI